MESIYAVFTLVIPLFILLALGFPICFTFLSVLFVNSIIYLGSVGPYMTLVSVYDSLAKFSLVPVPFFVFMGVMLFESDLAKKAIDAVSKIFVNVPGRLCYLATAGGALFGLLSGSNISSIVVLGTSLVPEMRERGYSKLMTFGPILASGGLAMIVPPSSLAVIYATLAEINVGYFLISGAIPGFIMALNYSLLIFLRLKLNPSLAPAFEAPKPSLKEVFRTIIVELLPLSVLIFLVTGVFVVGICTPTEASALGAIGATVMAAVYGRLNCKVFYKTMISAIKVTGMVLIIVSNATAYSYLLAYTGLIKAAAGFIAAIIAPPLVVLLLMILIILILGCFIDSVSIMMITLPIFLPVVKNLGFNPFVFGMIFLITCQMGGTSPPFGLITFAMKSVAPKDVKITDLYWAALPFLGCDAVSITLLIIFPALVTFLPNLLL